MVLVNWKLANVVSIFKKGKQEDAVNYRPVSLTSVPGKIAGKFILGVIAKHLRGTAVIGDSQHGLMRGKSCLTNLISFYDKVTHLAEQGKPVDVGFFCILARLLILSLTVSFWIKCPAHS